MTILYQAPHLVPAIQVQDFFVTSIGKVETLSSSVIGLTLCQPDMDALLPVARVLWPVEQFITANADLSVVVRQGIRRMVA